MNTKDMLTKLLEIPEKRHEAVDLAEHMLEAIKHLDEHMYNCLALKLHVELYGYHFDEHTAKKAVSHMKNFDGTAGEFWTLEQTSRLLTQSGIKANEYDWYYVLNMLHSDAGNIFRNDVNLYVKYATEVYFKDVDADDTKAFKHYISQKYNLY